MVPTLPPNDGPCTPAGHLHMDFGGDVSQFGDAQQAALTAKIAAALGIKPAELAITRHAVDEQGLNTGALGAGRIWHPTKVNVNFKFVGTTAITNGYTLELKVTLSSSV